MRRVCMFSPRRTTVHALEWRLVARLTTSKLFLWMTRSKTGDLRRQWTQIISDACKQFFLLHARCNGGSTWVSQTFKTIQGTRRIRITPIKSSRRLYSLECLGLSTGWSCRWRQRATVSALMATFWSPPRSPKLPGPGLQILHTTLYWAAFFNTHDRWNVWPQSNIAT